jgi:hypothetical protein
MRVSCLIPLVCLLAAGEPPDPPTHRLIPPPEHTMQRAGYPQEISCLAAPGRTASYCGGWIGGGCLIRGSAPDQGDGTWGWDYAGCGWYPGRLFLKWCHCGVEKPLAGYKTDGKPVPNIFAIQPKSKEKAEHEHE